MRKCESERPSSKVPRFCTGESSDLVAGENADAVSSQDIPQPNGAIRRPCGDVVGVGVEAGASDISEVPRKHPERLVVICCPQTVGENTAQERFIRLEKESPDRKLSCESSCFLPGDSVMSPGDKIVPMGRKLGVPHWVVMAFVAH